MCLVQRDQSRSPKMLRMPYGEVLQPQAPEKESPSCSAQVAVQEGRQAPRKSRKRGASCSPGQPQRFRDHVGRFWALLNTRDYMRARFALADEALRAATLDGVQECLDHFQDMMRLGRSDNMGLRDKVPALLLRLGRDQECYDFIKWWGTTAAESHYNSSDMDIPFLDIKDADVVEDPQFLLGNYNYGMLSHRVAGLLIKFKMLVDIRSIKIARKVVTATRRLPVELWEGVERHVIHSPLSVQFVGRPHPELINTETTLRLQCMKIGAAIVKANQHFMYEMLDLDEETLRYRPSSYSRGSFEEMSLVMQDYYPAWCEAVGAMDLLRDARACAARDSEDEAKEWEKDDKSGRTAEQILKHLSVNRLWGYLDYAIENGPFLGPWESRPSERRSLENKEAFAKALKEEMEMDEWNSDEYGDEDDDDDDDDDVLRSP
ncbi:hypothetical protein F4778DRAFT_275131 [Xylariomycetidae sp. FL2044]|nr:hypothetical protein F4778DRAFT_275131 [Xylariomycetidae sp. FL2044]